MIVILVKCRCHENNKIDRATAYKIVINNKNHYYCSEKDYLFVNQEKENRKNCLDNINKIFGYTVINTILPKELKEIANIHTYTKINSYLVDNYKFLEKIMEKEFGSEYGKIRYFSAILKNNLTNYKPKIPEPIKQVEDEIIDVKYKQKQRKKCLEEYIAEME